MTASSRKRSWSISVEGEAKQTIRAWFLQTAVLRALLDYLGEKKKLVPKTGDNGEFSIKWSYLGKNPKKKAD